MNYNLICNYLKILSITNNIITLLLIIRVILRSIYNDVITFYMYIYI